MSRPARRTIVYATGIVASTMLIGCERRAPDGDVAASVDGTTITRDAVNSAVAELTPAAGGSEQERQRLALEALITQRVLANAARDEALDREPRIQAMLESTQLKILASAYVERHTPAPSEQAIKTYFEAHAELFSMRRIYSLQELAIEATPEQLADVVKQYERSGTLNDMVVWLDANNLRYVANAAVKPAEELPGDFLPVVARMTDGQTARVSTSRGVTIVQLIGMQDAPLTLEQATPAISRYLANQSVAAVVEALSKALRAEAEIEYFPPFGAPPEGVH